MRHLSYSVRAYTMCACVHWHVCMHVCTASLRAHTRLTVTSIYCKIVFFTQTKCCFDKKLTPL